MQNRISTRRAFLQSSFRTVAAAAMLGPGPLLRLPAQASERKPLPIRLGGPAFADTKDPEELALAHRKLGYSAAYCPNLSVNDSAQIHAYTDAFARHDVVIAEVGRWVNLLDADLEKRRLNLNLVTDGLALAEAIGARCCVDIAGSF